MSNYELREQLNELEDELRYVERINAELKSELSIVATGMTRAHKELEVYNERLRNTLDNCSTSIRSSNQQVLDAIAMQGEIERLYSRFKAIELANKKIRAANHKKYYDCANYRIVRKIVQGIMDNLDVQMVSNQTILKSVEAQHLQTPDYWLTSVLISVMAWRNDDKELADRALERTIKLDKKNSSIFYMLFNLRMGREDAALKWFYTYQECELKGSDQRTFLMLFSLVSKTIAETDDVEDKTKSEIFTFIKKVIDANMRASDFSEEEVVGKITKYFNRMQPSDPFQYMVLRKHCNECDKLASLLMKAKNNINILEFILKTVNVSPEERNTFLKGYIDELIASPNQFEQEIYDEIAFNELVIQLEGEIDKAREQFKASQEKKASDLDLIGEMIDWIYERDSQVVNGQIRLSMFTLTKMLQEKAVETHVSNYRNCRTNQYPVSIDEYSTTVNFKDEYEELQKIDAFYTSMKNESMVAVRDWPAYVGFGVGAVAFAGSSFAGLWLLVLTFGGTVYGLSNLLSNRSKRKKIEQSCAESIRNTSQTMKQLFEEFKAYQKELDGYDTYSDKIKAELNKI